MKTAIDKTVRELALEDPSATRIFETLGIDYCCNGQRSLREACASAQVSIDDVLDSLDKARREAAQTDDRREWQVEPRASLIEHVEGTHHKYVRTEIPRILALLEKVCAAHGGNHPELFDVRETFHALAQELGPHLMKEETILFPYVHKLEAAASGHGAAGRAPFGSVRNPISMMEHEHDNAGNALRDLRERSGGYAAPPDACASYAALYQALAAFEKDLHQHIHLENNILFPRAVAIEQGR